VTSSPETAGDWVTVAVLGRTRGNRGELTAQSFSDKPERYQELREVYLFGEGARYEVESAWFHGSTLIFKFHGIDTISAAEALVGSEVRIPRSQRRSLDAGEFYHSDLIGCQVIDRHTGDPIGLVTAFDEGGGSGLLVVGDDLLIPFARSICIEIDLSGRRIVAELPEGLKGLNRP